MNPEQLITDIGDQIVAATRNHGSPLHVCFWQNQLVVLPALHTCDRHPIFLVIKDPCHWEGLNNRQWLNLISKIQGRTKVTLKCLLQLKSLTPQKSENS